MVFQFVFLTMDKPRYNQKMHKEVRDRLLGLNKLFYQTFGSEFSATRQRLQPGVKRILQSLPAGKAILDLGCGNGEFARQLVLAGKLGSYTGLDFSGAMLASAHQGWKAASVLFIETDLASPGWEAALVKPAGGTFDLVTAFAVLHHIPDGNLRMQILQQVRSLLPSGGHFIHSEWQFMNSPRLRRRIQSWEEAALTPGEVDEDDHLLDWRSGGRGLRYVHHFSKAELEMLAHSTGFEIISEFMSDGEKNQSGLYQTWEAS
jgi:SAM-dependent methyltransferase